MERLTTRNEYGGIIDVLNGVHTDVVRNRLVHKLAAYEDAEEQGKLVELPFKLGATVWVVEFDDDDEPYDFSGYQFIGCCDDVGFLAPSYNGDSSLDCILTNLLEETQDGYTSNVTVAYLHNIYATREEAEAALERSKP